MLSQIFNSAWDNTLTKINSETPADSIINTWWPPGHFIKSIAQRSVTFDGSTINYPQGYWLANVFLTEDEKEAAGILRMLNNGANQAADYLTGQGIKLSQAVKILKTITKLNISEAKKILNSKLTPEQCDHLLSLTHHSPPPSYLLIYNDLVEKNMELKFVGGWNFEKIEELNSSPNLKKTLPTGESPEYFQFLWDVAGGPYKYSGVFAEVARRADVASFVEGIKINLKTKECTVNSAKFGSGIPQSIFYVEDNQWKEKKLPGSKFSYSVILTEEDKHYECVLLDRALAKSMIMRLYFLKGIGLDYFKLFSEESDLTQRTKIVVYKIDWKRFQEDIGETAN
jgi:hypothetical protein